MLLETYNPKLAGTILARITDKAQNGNYEGTAQASAPQPNPHVIAETYKKSIDREPARTAGRIRIDHQYGRINTSATILVDPHAHDLAIIDANIPDGVLSIAFAGRNLEALTLGLLTAMAPATRSRILDEAAAL